MSRGSLGGFEFSKRNFFVEVWLMVLITPKRLFVLVFDRKISELSSPRLNGFNVSFTTEKLLLEPC